MRIGECNYVIRRYFNGHFHILNNVQYMKIAYFSAYKNEKYL